MSDIPEAAKTPRLVLTLSTCAFALMFAVWLMFGMLGVPIQKELGLSTVQFGWLTAITILNGALWRLPLGILTDRLGGRMVMTMVMLAGAVPCALISFATNFPQLLLFAFLVGLVGNSFSVGIAWNSAWSSKERQGLALGIFGAGNVGGSVTKLCGPLLISLVPAAGLLGGIIPGGWRAVPMIYALALVLCAVAVWLLAPAPDRKPSRGRSLAAMLSPLADLRVWRFGLYYVMLFGGFVALSLWLPHYYVGVYQVSLGVAGLLSAMFVFTASLMRPVGGWFADRYGARPMLYLVFTTIFLTCIPLALPASICVINLPTFVALTVVLGVAMGIGNSTVYKYITAYFPQDVGAVGGLVGTLGALGGFALPILFGYLDAWSGLPQGVFMVMLVLLTVCFLWLHLVVMRIKRQPAVMTQTIADRELQTA